MPVCSLEWVCHVLLPTWAMLSASRCSLRWSSKLAGQGDGSDGGSLVRWHSEESGDCNLGTLEPEACGYVIECASGVVIGVDLGVV